MQWSSGKHVLRSGPLNGASVNPFRGWAAGGTDGGSGWAGGSDQGSPTLGLCLLTIEPLGVILGSAKGRPTAQAAVDGRVPT